MKKKTTFTQSVSLTFPIIVTFYHDHRTLRMTKEHVKNSVQKFQIYGKTI